MDVLDRVRDAAPEAQVEERQLAVARRALMAEIRGARSAPSRRRRGLRWAGGALGAVAVGVVGMFIVGNLLPVDPGDPGTPSILVPPAASASELLKQAGRTSAAAADEPAAGQYLRIESTDEFLMLAREDPGTGRMSGMHTDSTGAVLDPNRENAQAGFLVASTSQLFIPADRSGEWVARLDGRSDFPQKFGPRAQEAIDEWSAMQGETQDQIQRAPGGRIRDGEGADDWTTIGDSARFAEMPRDPKALLEWYHAHDTTEFPADYSAFLSLSDDLVQNIAPADLRAAMFDAAALIPGVEVSHRDGRTVSLSLSANATGSDTSTVEIVLDTARGRVLSESVWTLPRASASVIPTSAPDHRRTVTVSVVDTAP